MTSVFNLLDNLLGYLYILEIYSFLAFLYINLCNVGTWYVRIFVSMYILQFVKYLILLSNLMNNGLKGLFIVKYGELPF